jgi:hypothetical protein
MRNLERGKIKFQRAGSILTKEIRDVRIIPDQNLYTGRDYKMADKDQLDNIAVKEFGPGNETSWYFIADRNVEEIVGWKADFTYIDKLKLPVISEYL